MIVTSGYVAVKTDGTFLHVSEGQTHTGYHVRINEVDSLEHASIFTVPRLVGSYYKPISYREPLIFVPVEVRREVVLKGYGVKNENQD